MGLIVLNKNNILKTKTTLNKKEINSLYKTGKKLNFLSFFVLWDFNNNLKDKPIRLVISVPKKNIKKAVDRNYIKRCFKEIYRLNQGVMSKKIINPINIIITYTKTQLIEFNQLQEELLTLFKEINKEVNEKF